LLPAFLIFFISCDNSSKKKHVEIKNGEVSISYNMSGNGDTSVVFVHGWGISKDYWNQQMDDLGSQYTVVALDLGGHGQSGHNRENWTIEEFAKDVRAVIEGLKLDNVILVGHSMGGEIILQTALTLPGKVIGFIAIDNFKHFVTSFTPREEKEINDFMKGLKSNFDTTAATYTRLALFPRDYSDTNSINRGIRSIQQVDTVVAIKALESLMYFALKDSEMIARLPIPAHLIVSDYTTTNQESFTKATKTGSSIRVIRGTGHYPMIEKPEQFTEVLRETIHQVGKKQ
ncbi:MAG TPA: alpha/beta hydrolase, partial [Chitinophagaceae bacterium]|nr:alpha/beta hydrolase [Chitinophagaceae bacterium]